MTDNDISREGDSDASPTGSPDDASKPSLTMLCSEEECTVRANQPALLNFVRAVRAVVDRAAEESGRGMAVQISMALLPEKRTLVEVQRFPRDSLDARVERIQAQLAGLRGPPVRGPVAFVLEANLAGGAANPSERFSFPFCTLAPDFKGGSIEDLLRQAAGLPGLDGQSTGTVEKSPHAEPNTLLNGWQRLWKTIGTFFGIGAVAAAKPQAGRGENELPPGAEPAAEISAEHPAEQPAWPVPFSVESLSQCIADLPSYLPYYHARGSLLRTAGRFEEALADFEKVLEAEPADDDALFSRGICLLNLDRLQPALADIDAVLRLWPEFPGALAARAEIYWRLEAWDAADGDLSKAIESNPFEARLPFSRARLRANRGRIAAAIADAQAAIEADPNCDDYYALHGSLLMKQADSPEELTAALGDFQMAANLAPERAEHFAACGDAHLRLGQPDEAVAACEQALKLDPEFGPAFGIRGMAEDARNGPPEKIIDDCTTAIDKECASTMVYMGRASAYLEQRELYAALSDLDRAIELSPEFAPAYNSRGAVRGQLEMPEEARDDFERAIELAPKWPVPYLNRAVWFRQHENLDAAIDDCGQALECDPEEINGYLLRAACRIDNNEQDLARMDLDTAVERGQENAQAWCDRGAFFFQCGETEKARSDLDRALTVEPDHLESLFHRSKVLSTLRELDAALADVNRLIELRPALVEAYTGRGSIWLMKGDSERAQEDFDAAIRQKPEAAEDLRILQQLIQSSFDHEQERFEKAIDLLNGLIAEHPDCFAAYRLRAAALWYSEQFVEAIDDFDWLLEQHEERADYFSARGQVWAELGEFDRALEDLDRALALLDDQQISETIRAYAHNGRGLALAGLDRRAEAVAEFERSIKSRPQNAWAQFNLGLTYYQAGDQRKAAVCFRLSLELNGPRLTPRKRDRARAFLKKMDAPADKL